MRTLVLVTAAALLLVGGAIPADASAEGDFVARVNAERGAAGLPDLQVHWDLADDARVHAQRMADAGDLHHNPDLGSVTNAWQALGENVGVGASVASLHEAFMSSPAHRRNILGNFDGIGVGVVQDAAGTLWVTVIFMRGPASPDEEATVTTTTIPDAPPTTVAAAPVPEAAPVEPPAAPLADAAAAPPQPMGRPGLVHPIME